MKNMTRDEWIAGGLWLFGGGGCVEGGSRRGATEARLEVAE